MEEKNEVWVPIPGYEGLYEASSRGALRSLDRRGKHGKGFALKRGKTLSQALMPSGYRYASLSKDGVLAQFSVHRLVCMSFIGERPPGHDICHYDGDRANNHIENLRYDTKKANAQDKRRHSTNNDGDTNPRAKLIAKQVLEIFARCEEGEDQHSLAKEYEISSVTINHIATGRTWGSVTGAHWRRRHVVVTARVVRRINELQDEGLTLEGIAKELDISKSTAFRHSKNKSFLTKKDGYSTVEGALT